MNKAIRISCFIGALLFLALVPLQFSVYGQTYPTVDLSEEQSAATNQYTNRRRILVHRFGDLFCECANGRYEVVPCCQIYGVQQHTAKLGRKDVSTLTGIIVFPANKANRHYKSLKIYTEIISKSQGKIKRFAELIINRNTSLFINKLLPEGAVFYKRFKWSVPKDIDLDTLGIIQCVGVRK